MELISVSQNLRIWKDVNLEFLCLATLFHKKSIEVKKILTAACNMNFKLTRFNKQISCKFIKIIQFYAVPDVHTQKDKEIFIYSINSRNSWWILIIMDNRKEVARYTFNQNYYSRMVNHIVTRITTAAWRCGSNVYKDAIHKIIDIRMINIRLSGKCLSFIDSSFTTMYLYTNMKPNLSNVVIFILIDQNGSCVIR